MAAEQRIENHANSATIVELQIGGLDAAGAEVLQIYAKYVPYYAVYGVADGVRIQFADDPKTAASQRSKLVALAPQRGEIGGLLSSWRRDSKETPDGELYVTSLTTGLKSIFAGAGKRAASAAAVRMFDRRVADALVVALQGTVTDAAALMDAILVDIQSDHAQRARLRAVSIAIILALLVSTSAGIALGSMSRPLEGIDASPAANLLLAVGAGAIGALFSILQRPQRMAAAAPMIEGQGADIAIRIATGVVSAALVQSLLNSGVVTFGIGDLTLAGGRLLPSPEAAAITGFIAGFAERLAPTAFISVRAARRDPMPATLPAATTSAALEDVRQVVAASVRQGLAGPELTKFDGYVTPHLAWGEAGENKAIVTLRFSSSPQDGAERLLIDDGADAPIAEFVVECEPEGSPRNLVTRVLSVPTMKDFTAAPIEVHVPNETERIWVEILQHDRVIQTFRLALPARLLET